MPALPIAIPKYRMKPLPELLPIVLNLYRSPYQLVHNLVTGIKIKDARVVVRKIVYTVCCNIRFIKVQQLILVVQVPGARDAVGSCDVRVQARGQKVDLAAQQLGVVVYLVVGFGQLVRLFETL